MYEVTDGNGEFHDRVRISRNAEYVARVPRTQSCRKARSIAILVEARAVVVTRVGDDSPQRGTNFRIHGEVKPRHPGTEVLLQEKRHGRWVEMFRESLSRHSTFSFFPLADWHGSRRLRVKWPRGDYSHSAGFGRGLVITTHA
jgi:hypothetical protein